MMMTTRMRMARPQLAPTAIRAVWWSPFSAERQDSAPAATWRYRQNVVLMFNLCLISPAHVSETPSIHSSIHGSNASEEPAEKYKPCLLDYPFLHPPQLTLIIALSVFQPCLWTNCPIASFVVEDKPRWGCFYVSFSILMYRSCHYLSPWMRS